MISSKAALAIVAVAAVLVFAGACAASPHVATAASGNHSPGPQGYLGIMFHDVSDADVALLRLKDKRGAEIIMVDHDGPAGKAGLRVHDVVLRMNGALVDGEEQLRKMLHDSQPGHTIQLTICRDGAEQTLNATLLTREEVIRQAQAQRWTVPTPSDDVQPAAQEAVAPAPTGNMFSRSFMSGHLLPLLPVYTGATMDAVGPQLGEFLGVKDGKGLLVHAVEMNSPAAAAGLHAGDVVVRMNGSRVATEKDWSRALHENKGKAIAITVIRDHREQTLTMIADGKKRSAAEIPPPPGDSTSLLMLR